jgi:ATP phosphoribosyltransferase regulatory subunit
VQLMIGALRRAGIARVHVDLGHPAIYRALVAGLALDPEDAATLFDAVQQKDAQAAATLPGGSKSLAALTRLNGGGEVLAEARAQLPGEPAIRGALEDLQSLASRCAADGVEVSFDLAELGGFNYESGVVFSAFTGGSPDSIARGGRYDEVGASFGRARPATGFTMDLRQLAALAPAPRERRAILAPASDDPALAAEVERLRASGEIVAVELPGHEGASAESGADRALAWKDGQWRVCAKVSSSAEKCHDA